MGTTRKTITLTEQQDAWIKAQIDAGGFTNDSEYIRGSCALLRAVGCNAVSYLRPISLEVGDVSPMRAS